MKSLAAEAREIRQEVKRCGPLYRAELTEHRRGRVRAEARLAQLVLGFVRGRPYRLLEGKAHKPPDVQQLLKKAQRHGLQTTERELIDWLK